MKWGQWAATRADIFPPDMCKELAHLQVSSPLHVGSVLHWGSEQLRFSYGN